MANDNVTVRAHAKINWALNVCSRRADGYHILDMLVQRIGLHDVLQFSPADSQVIFYILQIRLRESMPQRLALKKFSLIWFH